MTFVIYLINLNSILMKKQITFLVFAFGFLGVVLLTSETTDSRGKAGSTGSPGEHTCAQSGCHSDNPVNSGTGSVAFTSSMTAWEYVPGTTYTITFTVNQTGFALLGLGVECLDTLNKSAGTFAITAPSETRLLNTTVGGSTRANVTHQSGGGAVGTPGSKAFSFSWTAPTDTNIKKVTFYGAGNAANGTGGTGGDFIYSTSQVATKKASTTPASISTVEKDNIHVQVFPNPSSEVVSVAALRNPNLPLEIRLVSVDGKVQNVVYTDESNASPMFHTQIDVKGFSRGQYIVQLIQDGSISTQRVILQ